MNAAMEVINVTQMRAVPTLLVLTAVLARKDSLEMDVRAQVEHCQVSIIARTDGN